MVDAQQMENHGKGIKMSLKKENADNINRLKLSFLWTYVFGLIAHGFVYLNTTYNHDGSMIYLTDDEWKISIGRYMGVFYRYFRSRYSAPWLTGMLALCYLALCTFIIVMIFDIKKPAFIAAIGACFATNYSLIFMNASTIHESDTYMLSVLIYVLAAFFLIESSNKCTDEKENRQGILKILNNKYICIALSGICIGLALGIYQAYITMPFAIVVIFCCLSLLRNEKVKDNLIRVAYSIAAYVIGAIVYVVGLKAYSAITGVAMNEDGHNSITGVFSLAGWDIAEGLANAYKLFYHQFFDITKFNYRFLVAANGVLIIGCVALALYMAFKRRINKINLILVIVILALMPAILGALYMLSLIGHIMMCQYILVYVFPLVLVYEYVYGPNAGKTISNSEGAFAVQTEDNEPDKHNENNNIDIEGPNKATEFNDKKKNRFTMQQAVALVCLICIFTVTYYSVTFANAYYLEQHLEYQSTREYMSNVLNDVARLDGYVPGETEVLFIGLPQWSDMAHSRDGYTGFELDSKGWDYEYNYSITGYYTYTWFVNQIMNENVYVGSEEEAIEYTMIPEISDMPEYPKEGSIQMYDDKAIVKIGRWY